MFKEISNLKIWEMYRGNKDYHTYINLEPLLSAKGCNTYKEGEAPRHWIIWGSATLICNVADIPGQCWSYSIFSCKLSLLQACV